MCKLSRIEFWLQLVFRLRVCDYFKHSKKTICAPTSLERLCMLRPLGADLLIALLDDLVDPHFVLYVGVAQLPHVRLVERLEVRCEVERDRGGR